MSALDRALTIDDLKKLAKRRVPKQFFDYIDSGAWTEQTYRANEDDFKKITFRQRVAVNPIQHVAGSKEIPRSCGGGERHHGRRKQGSRTKQP